MAKAPVARLRQQLPAMVKSVVAEETQLSSFEDRLFQSAVPAQVGLVIGKLSPSLDKGFVFQMISTPLNDAGEPACSLAGSGKEEKKRGPGSKGKSQADVPVLVVDSDWVAEHARQVSRMLLGGVNVVGIYVWAAENSFKASSTILWQTAKAVAESAPFYGSEPDERLLIHISYSPRRWSCRNCLLGSSFISTNLRPCDFKLGKLLPSIQSYRCTYNFDIRLPVFCADTSANSFKDAIHKGISLHARELNNAQALVDGNLVFEGQPSTSDVVHEVELLLPLSVNQIQEARSTEEVLGIFVLSGAVCSFAYSCPKEPVSQIISDIKGDIITNLRSRLDIICDQADRNMDSYADDEMKSNATKPTHQLILHELSKPCSLGFPKRVLVPWLGNLFVCDYLQPSETIEDLKDSWKEILSMEVLSDTTAILELEKEATSLVGKSFWDVAHSYSNSESHAMRKPAGDLTTVGSRRPLGSSNVIIAPAILFLAILVGLWLTYFRV